MWDCPLLHLKGDIVIILLLLTDERMTYFIDSVAPDSEAMKSSEVSR